MLFGKVHFHHLINLPSFLHLRKSEPSTEHSRLPSAKNTTILLYLHNSLLSFPSTFLFTLCQHVLLSFPTLCSDFAHFHPEKTPFPEEICFIFLIRCLLLLRDLKCNHYVTLGIDKPHYYDRNEGKQSHGEDMSLEQYVFSALKYCVILNLYMEFPCFSSSL